VTFVDTSAIYALLDRSDTNHAAAKTCWFALLNSGAALFTTNYVVVECCALAQSRLGLDAVRTIQEDLLPVVEVAWVDEAAHLHAMTALLAAQRRKLSLVDCVSFAAMRNRGSQVALAFDSHFQEERFAFPGDGHAM
jgi:predicted nucleic acid-binding protein